MTVLSPPNASSRSRLAADATPLDRRDVFHYLGALTVLATGLVDIEQYAVDNYFTGRSR